MRHWIADHDTATFLVLTYGISWPLWFASGALSQTPVRAPDLRWLIAQVGVFAPALAGMVIGACVAPSGVRRALRLLGLVFAPAIALGLWIATRGFASFTTVDERSTLAMIVLGVWIMVCLGARANRLVSWLAPPAGGARTLLWSIGCLVVPAALFLAAWAIVGGVAKDVAGAQAMPVRDLTPSGLVAAFAMNLAYGGSLGEEPGWRGAWLPRLLQRDTPVVASLVISFWWALWHAPIDVSQGMGLAGVGALVVRQAWTLPLTILFTWVTLRAGGSLVPPLVLHTTVNAIPDFAMSQPARYQGALVLFCVLLAAFVTVVSVVDPRLRRAGATSNEK